MRFLDSTGLATLDERAVFRRLCSGGKTGFKLALLCGLVALCAGRHVEHILIGAIEGLPAFAMVKILTYTSFVLVGLAFCVSMFRIGRPLRGLACNVSELTFDSMSAVTGAFAGAFFPMCWALGWRGFFGGFWILLTMLVGQSVMYMLPRLLHGAYAQRLFDRHWRPVSLGLFVIALGLWAFHAETWPELGP